MIRLEIQTADFRRQLERFRKDALPQAVAGSLNAVAHAAHRQSERNVRERLTLRNAYTLRSLRYWRASPKRQIGRINAITGTSSEYLPVQETGGTQRARRRRFAIPTTAARISRSKARPVAPRFRMNRMGELTNRGGKFWIMRSGRGKLGIFTRPSRRRLVMIRDLSVRSYHLRAVNWHRDAVRKYNRRSLYMRVFAREAGKVLGRIR